MFVHSAGDLTLKIDLFKLFNNNEKFNKNPTVKGFNLTAFLMKIYFLNKIDFQTSYDSSFFYCLFNMAGYRPDGQLSTKLVLEGKLTNKQLNKYFKNNI